MRKNLIRKITTNQKLLKFKEICYIKKFFKLSQISLYGILSETLVNSNRTTKYVPICQLQGRYKKTLKVFHFNRHLIRENRYKTKFNSLTSNIW